MIRLRGGGPGGGRRGRHVRGGRDHDASRPPARCSRSRATGRSRRSPSTSAALDLWPAPPGVRGVAHYRLWAYESAALDLALRQAGMPLLGGARPRAAPGDVRRLAAPRRPARRSSRSARILDALPDACASSSTRPATGRRARRRARRRPARSTRSTSRACTRARSSTRPPTPASTAAWSRPSREAWIEDPRLNGETEPVLEPHRGRITWDANIHSVADIEGLPFPPRMVNIKPSRFGPLRELMRAYDYCAERGIGDVRRRAVRARARARADPVPRVAVPPRRAERRRAGRLQRLDPPAGLPASPLAPEPSAIGFRWGEWNDR